MQVNRNVASTASRPSRRGRPRQPFCSRLSAHSLRLEAPWLFARVIRDRCRCFPSVTAYPRMSPPTRASGENPESRITATGWRQIPEPRRRRATKPSGRRDCRNNARIGARRPKPLLDGCACLSVAQRSRRSSRFSSSKLPLERERLPDDRAPNAHAGQHLSSGSDSGVRSPTTLAGRRARRLAKSPGYVSIR